MKNTKKIGAVLASATVAMTIFAGSASAATYSDVKVSYEHYDAIMELTDRKVVKGFPDGTFRPNADVTRGQAAKMLALATDLDVTNVSNPGFTDIPTSHQYYGPIAALVEAGIIDGFEDNTYRPGEKLTRAQMSKIISLTYNLPVAKWTGTPFVDVTETKWYKQYVQTLYDFEITKGTTATTYSPGNPVRRGQLAAFITRVEAIEVGEKIDTGIDVIVDEQINDRNDIPLTATFDSDSNSVSFKVVEPEASVQSVADTGVFNMIPYSDIETATLSGSSVNLADLSPQEAIDAVYAALDITSESTLAELTGKTFSITLTTVDGTYTYSFSFTE